MDKPLSTPAQFMSRRPCKDFATVMRALEALYSRTCGVQKFLSEVKLVFHLALMKNNPNPFTRASLASITADIFAQEAGSKEKQDIVEWLFQVIFVQFVEESIYADECDAHMRDYVGWLKDFTLVDNKLPALSCDDMLIENQADTGFELFIPGWILKSRELLFSNTCHGTWFKKLRSDVFKTGVVDMMSIIEVKKNLFEKIIDITGKHFVEFQRGQGGAIKGDKLIDQTELELAHYRKLCTNSLWANTLEGVKQEKNPENSILVVLHRNVLAECYTAWQNQYVLAHESVFISDKDKETRVVEMAKQMSLLQSSRPDSVSVCYPKFKKDKCIFASSNRLLDQCACIDLALKLQTTSY